MSAKLDRSKFIARFAEEAREIFGALEDGLMQLETDGDSTDLMTDLMRRAHTLKGSSRMVKLTTISEITHKFEDYLVAIKEKRIDIDSPTIELLLAAVDHMKILLDLALQKKEDQGLLAPENLTEALIAGSRGENIKTKIFEIKKEISTARERLGAEPGSGAANSRSEKAPAEKSAAPSGWAKSAPAPEPESSPPAPSGWAKKEASQTDKNLDPPPKQKQPSPAPEGAAAKADKKQGETLRIYFSDIDETLKDVGEIIIRLKHLILLAEKVDALGQKISKYNYTLRGSAAVVDDGALGLLTELSSDLREVSRDSSFNIEMVEMISSGVHEKLLGMRMLPFGTLFDTFRRPIRDLAAELDREIELIIEGAEAPVDKNILDSISDPLLHILRNSIDHGIETPRERLAAGKPEKGVIKVSARLHGDRVNVLITDDGRGIDINRIKEKAIEKGMIDAREAENLPRKELLDFIFMPGFSTAAILTDISGRGVGMDVVKRDLEAIKGEIEIETEAGVGTSISLSFPLSLIALKSLIVGAGGETFALPLDAVVETLKISEQDLIDVVDMQAIRLNERLIAVSPLADILRLPREEGGSLRFCAIIKAAGRELGILVEKIISEEEVIIKPAPESLSHIRMISGATIIGGGEVTLILNPIELINRSATVEKRKTGLVDKKSDHPETPRILVVDDSLNTREIEKTILESSGYQVMLAENGREALDICNAEQFDLVVTDIEMPEMDGFTLIENLRELDAFKNIPIIIVSSRANEKDKRRGIEVGASAYIVKGAFDQTGLIDAVESLL